MGDVPWLAALAASIGALSPTGLRALVVEPVSGRIVAATDAVVDLLGPVPPTVQGLVEEGLVARPDLDRLQAHLEAWRVVDDLEGRGRESAHTWTDSLRVHPPDGPDVALELSVVHHRRSTGEAVTITLTAGEPVGGPTSSAENLGEFWTVFDVEMRIIAEDPRVAQLGLDPHAMVGVMSTVITHPEDIPGPLPLVIDVIEGTRPAADYTVRVATSDGRWVPLDTQLRRLVTADGIILIARHRLTAGSRQVIPAGVLSARELEVVSGLFDGLRVGALADRDQVSVGTVRKQLASVFRKLGVSGQAELLASYHRPDPRPAGP